MATTTFSTASSLYTLALIGVNIGTPVTSSSPSAVATRSTTTAPSATATTSPAQSSNSPPSGLSRGAKAEIAIGDVVAALLACILAFFILRKRKSKKQIPAPAGNSEPYHNQPGWQQKAEMDSNNTYYPPTPELKGRPVTRPPQELEAR